MSRNGLIVLQAVGALSILAYPFVLLANVMSIAATGSTAATRLPWILLSFYPLVWIALWIFSWRAMKTGAVGLAFGLSSIPVLCCLVPLGLFVFSWIGFGLGTAGIGNGGLHSTRIIDDNPVIDSILIAADDIQLGPPETSIEKALRDMDAHPEMVNHSVGSKGSPLNVALGAMNITPDGLITGDPARAKDRIRLVRALVQHGAHFNADESTDLKKAFALRRVMLDGPVTTKAENPLVWRVVTRDRGQKPFNPLTDKFPDPRDGPPPFLIRENELPLMNKSTRLHGTPVYATLLINSEEFCAVIVKAGGRLSAEEARDPAAMAVLETMFAKNAGLRAAYH